MGIGDNNTSLPKCICLSSIISAYYVLSVRGRNATFLFFLTLSLASVVFLHSWETTIMKHLQMLPQRLGTLRMRHLMRSQRRPRTSSATYWRKIWSKVKKLSSLVIYTAMGSFNHLVSGYWNALSILIKSFWLVGWLGLLLFLSLYHDKKVFQRYQWMTDKYLVYLPLLK